MKNLKNLKNLNLSQKEEEISQEKTVNTCSTFSWHRKFSSFQRYIHINAQAANDLYVSPTIVEPFMIWKISELI